MKIVVTRPLEQAGELVRRLRALGHDVAVCPLIEVEPIGDEPIDASGYDWVVLTSPNGARELARRLNGRPGRLAAIGPGTAEALATHGLSAQLVPRISTQEGLVREFPRPAGRVLFAGAEGARRLLVEELGAHFLPLYRTRPLQPQSFPSADLVVLASASAARAFAALGARIPAVSIGPETTSAARDEGVEVVAEASTHDLDGLVSAVESATERD